MRVTETDTSDKVKRRQNRNANEKMARCLFGPQIRALGTRPIEALFITGLGAAIEIHDDKEKR